MESFPVLVVKAKTRADAHAALERARTEAIYGLAHQRDHGRTYFEYQVDTTTAEEALALCERLAGDAAVLGLWCCIQEEPEEILVRVRRKKLSVERYEVDLVGEPEEDVDFESFRRGLPKSVRFQAFAEREEDEEEEDDEPPFCTAARTARHQLPEAKQRFEALLDEGYDERESSPIFAIAWEAILTLEKILERDPRHAWEIDRRETLPWAFELMELVLEHPRFELNLYAHERDFPYRYRHPILTEAEFLAERPKEYYHIVTRYLWPSYDLSDLWMLLMPHLSETAIRSIGEWLEYLASQNAIRTRTKDVRFMKEIHRRALELSEK